MSHNTAVQSAPSTRQQDKQMQVHHCRVMTSSSWTCDSSKHHPWVLLHLLGWISSYEALMVADVVTALPLQVPAAA